MTRTRTRQAAALVAAVLAAATLVGCGSDTETETGTGSESGSTARTESEESTSESSFPVTIEHKFGATTIEEEPERVVTIGLMEQDAVLAMGVVPVGTTEWWGDRDGAIFEWAEDELGDAERPERLASEEEYELVAALEPDLIVAMYSGIKQKDYDLYSAIAPVVAAPEGTVDYGVSWQDMTLTVGKALGKAELAQRSVDEIDQQVADLRAEHPEFEGEEAAFASTYDGIWVYGPQDPRTRILQDLGFVYPEALRGEAGEEFGFSMSAEKADLLDVAAIVWVDDERSVRKEVPTYDTLDLAKYGRTVFYGDDDSPEYYATGGFVSVLSMPLILEDLVPRLAAAVDDDPKTSTD